MQMGSRFNARPFKATIPVKGEQMYPSSPLNEAFDRISQRRSVKAIDIREPGPSEEQTNQILEAAIRVPDHGKLGPWRFILFEGQSRDDFGQFLSKTFQLANPTAPSALLQLESQRFMRAPLIICVAARIREEIKIPSWEQQLSVGACCQNILIAANLLGFAGQWLTEWYSYDRIVNDKLGLENDERVAAYIYLGSADEKPAERDRPTLDGRVSRWAS